MHAVLTMARSKKGRAAQAARYKAAANSGPSTSHHTYQDIASHFLPRASATHSQPDP